MNWITIIHRRPIAALNTLWYFAERNSRKELKTITLFCDPDYKKESAWFQKQAAVLLKYHQKTAPKFQVEYIDQEDIHRFRKSLKSLLSASKQKVVIDMTSGRKAHSALLLLMGELFMGTVEHVFYNFLHSEDFLHFPYPAIPPEAVEIVDLLEH